MKRRADPPPVMLALFAAVAALLTHAFAWGVFAPAMALAPIDGLCTVAQYGVGDEPDDDRPKADLRHCALSLLAQGLTAPPAPPALALPNAAAPARDKVIPATTTYVGWFLSTRQARGPPGGA